MKANPRSNLSENAIFNAAVNYEKGGDLFAAISMYESVAGREGKKVNKGLKKKSLRILATLYEKTGQYQKAASAFEMYASRYPKDKLTPDFYFNAAVIRDGLQFYTAAIRNYEKYLRKVENWIVKSPFFSSPEFGKSGKLEKGNSLVREVHE